MFPANTKFLIIDDFSTMRKIVKKALTDLGFSQITEADDGATAFPMIQEALSKGEGFGCIISDWNMPKMTGLDLLKNCRANAQLKTVPFILVTAESEQKQILEAVQAGVSDYVVKPFTSAILKQKLENAWNKFNKNVKAA